MVVAQRFLESGRERQTDTRRPGVVVTWNSARRGLRTWALQATFAGKPKLQPLHVRTDIRMRAYLVLTALMVLFVDAPASAWHGDAHEAVARIAWLQLDKPNQDALTQILREHVHFKVFLNARLPKGVDMTLEEWAFVRAARWPDWVRDPRAETHSLTKEESDAITKEFHKGGWHFVNLPIIHPADVEHVDAARLAELTHDALEPEFKKDHEIDNPQHALAALKQNLKVLRDVTAASADRAVAICWVLHLVGDIHQPLHAAALIARAESLPSSDFAPPPAFSAPHGDSGGNRLAIRLKDTDTKATVLHSYWDALIFADVREFERVETKVRSQLKKDELQPDRLGELKDHPEFLDWAKESQDLARNVDYRKDGTPESEFLAFTPLPITHSQHELNTILDSLKAPVLSKDYQARATSTAERRIVLAGLRLGGLLKITN
jgi:S1/P1 Nuclease